MGAIVGLSEYLEGVVEGSDECGLNKKEQLGSGEKIFQRCRYFEVSKSSGETGRY